MTELTKTLKRVCEATFSVLVIGARSDIISDSEFAFTDKEHWDQVVSRRWSGAGEVAWFGLTGNRSDSPGMYAPFYEELARRLDPEGLKGDDGRNWETWKFRAVKQSLSTFYPDFITHRFNVVIIDKGTMNHLKYRGTNILTRSRFRNDWVVAEGGEVYFPVLGAPRDGLFPLTPRGPGELELLPSDFRPDSACKYLKWAASTRSARGIAKVDARLSALTLLLRM